MIWHKIFSKDELEVVINTSEKSDNLKDRIIAKLTVIADDCENATRGDLELSDHMDDFVHSFLDGWRP